jgi:hypothetical protein
MSFEITPSPGQLRELLPGVAARMEEDFVVNQLRELGIVFSKRRTKGELVIGIPMTPGHLMQIRAVDVGPGGRKEFVTFVRVPAIRMGNKVTKPSVKETIRAHVEITSVKEDEVFNTFSYTLHESSMEDIIRSAIEGAYQTRNLMLKPLDKKSPRKPKRISPVQDELGDGDE